MTMYNRRNFQKMFAGALFSAPFWRNAVWESQGTQVSPGVTRAAGGLTQVEGLKVGHFTHARRPTGCTVILAEKGAVAGVDVRGSAPGTRETDLLNPINSVQRIHAILLAGGSAFGLDAAGGVVQFLEEKGIGYETRVARIPIVPAAILIDLAVGDSKIRPDKASGYAACQNATSQAVVEGNVGAGAGATVGKLFGMERAMKAGVGTASIKVGNLVVAALVAVNAVGDIYDFKAGKIVAGARTPDGKKFANTIETIKSAPLNWGTGKPSASSDRLQEWARDAGRSSIAENTTIGVVATNAAFDKVSMTKIAQMAHDGYARAINPVHTPSDGDTIFALSTEIISPGSGTPPVIANVGLVGALAAEVMAQAILRAALTAESLPGLPAARDMRDVG